jgi:F-type H+-transporting ATPase subunit delta
MKHIGMEYASALYGLAKDEGLDKRILGEMNLLGEVIGQNREYLKILSAPNLSQEERCSVADEALRGKVHPYVLNFLKILIEKGYARSFPDCCACYESLYNEDHGILRVKATTAVRLSETQLQQLQKKLESSTGKQIALVNTVDRGILGGVRLDFDGKRMDDTVRHRLDALRDMLENTTL